MTRDKLRDILQDETTKFRKHYEEMLNFCNVINDYAYDKEVEIAKLKTQTAKDIYKRIKRLFDSKSVSEETRIALGVILSDIAANYNFEVEE